MNEPDNLEIAKSITPRSKVRNIQEPCLKSLTVNLQSNKGSPGEHSFHASAACHLYEQQEEKKGLLSGPFMVLLLAIHTGQQEEIKALGRQSQSLIFPHSKELNSLLTWRSQSSCSSEPPK